MRCNWALNRTKLIWATFVLVWLANLMGFHIWLIKYFLNRTEWEEDSRYSFRCTCSLAISDLCNAWWGMNNKIIPMSDSKSIFDSWFKVSVKMFVSYSRLTESVNFEPTNWSNSSVSKISCSMNSKCTSQRVSSKHCFVGCESNAL